MFGIRYLSLDSSQLAGCTTNVFAVFKPTPAVNANGLSKPHLTPNLAGAPSKGHKPPMVAPSEANLNLFLNLATARSDPVKFSVSSFL